MKRLFYVLAAITILFSACQNTIKSGDPHPNQSHLTDSAFATPESPVESPMGKYTLSIVAEYSDNVYTNRFEVLNDSGLIFDSGCFYRTRDRLLFVWDDKENIWVYSSDTGTDVWVKDQDSWIIQDYTPSQILEEVPVPMQEALSSSSYMRSLKETK